MKKQQKLLKDHQTHKLPSEENVMSDLEKLCRPPGYIHALAYICFRDNFVQLNEEMNATVLLPQYKPHVLLHSEIAVLIGHLIKSPIDSKCPPFSVINDYVRQSDQLLIQLHESMSPDIPRQGTIEDRMDYLESFLKSGIALKEAIFYHGQPAYPFQYLSFAVERYSDDKEWMKKVKGFDVSEVVNLFSLVERILLFKVNILLQEKKKSNEIASMLPIFTFTIEELEIATELNPGTIKRILDQFSTDGTKGNAGFCKIGDFNICSAHPLIRIHENEYVSLHRYLLSESIYKGPFYWMCEDNPYQPTASKHRGLFCEKFVIERLRLIFDEKYLFHNVEFFQGKGNIIGEIDVLLSFGRRAVIFQAKSKQLTLASRKGSVSFIHKDFQAAIQDAYDQGFKCGKYLTDKSISARVQTDDSISVPRDFDKIYIIPIISENYPALNFQVHQFLKFETSSIICPPLVMDIFFLDVLTEMLSKPLYFFTYLDRRIEFHNRIITNQELTIFSHFIKRNLHIESNIEMMMLADDIASDIDAAMIVRREGLPGERIPDGILTRNKDTHIGRVIEGLISSSKAEDINLVSFLLSLSEDSVISISKKLEELRKEAVTDRRTHDLSVEFTTASTGLTIHWTTSPESESLILLSRHCEKRKYRQKMQKWVGLALSPLNGSLRFHISIDYKWTQNNELDKETSTMPNFLTRDSLFGGSSKIIKRNETCRCGSGKKYKHCCGRRISS